MINEVIEIATKFCLWIITLVVFMYALQNVYASGDHNSFIVDHATTAIVFILLCIWLAKIAEVVYLALCELNSIEPKYDHFWRLLPNDMLLFTVTILSLLMFYSVVGDSVTGLLISCVATIVLLYPQVATMYNGFKNKQHLTI